MRNGSLLSVRFQGRARSRVACAIRRLLVRLQGSTRPPSSLLSNIEAAISDADPLEHFTCVEVRSKAAIDQRQTRSKANPSGTWSGGALNLVGSSRSQ
jgi:hypothetical protein